MKPLVYSVEDDINIQNVVRIALSNSGFDVFVFEEAKGFFEAMETQKPNLVLLDIMLPGKSGIEILDAMKKNPRWEQIKVMIISAKGNELDKVIGLDQGADDYLVKPFGVLELVSRVKALLRRDLGANIDTARDVLGLKIIPSEMVCEYQGKQERFTNKEFALLELLLDNNGVTITREKMIESVWGYDFLGESRTIDVHIKELRRKLKKIGLPDDVIQTKRGIGYKMVL